MIKSSLTLLFSTDRVSGINSEEGTVVTLLLLRDSLVLIFFSFFFLVAFATEDLAPLLGARRYTSVDPAANKTIKLHMYSYRQPKQMESHFVK